jgi:outer membrane immunogenic protein
MLKVLVGMMVLSAPLAASARERFEGWRAGIHVGAAFAETDYKFADRGALVGTISNASDTGPLIGISGGYDYAMGDWTLGMGIAVERAVVDEASAVVVPGGQVATDTDFMWMARIGPRVGYAAGDVLIYAEGGLAAAYIDQKIISPVGTIDDASGHLGWTAGIGAEVALTPHISAVAEVRLSDLSAFTYDAGRFSAQTSGMIRAMSVGLTWRW